MLKPLCAYRTEHNKAHLVPSRSVDSYTPAQLYDKLENNPYSFLQIIRPETDLLLTNEERFERIRERLNGFIENNIFELDSEPGYYLYEQTTRTSKYTGLIGLLNVNDTKVHLHENTLDSREKLFAAYLETTGFQAEPILIFGASSTDRKSLISTVKLERPIFDFFTTNEIGHRMWKVDGTIAEELALSFETTSDYFLADGHHRYASSCRVAESLDKNEGAQNILAMFMDEEEIGIDAFERWLRIEDGNRSIDDFSEVFTLERKEGSFDTVEGDIEVFIEHNWWTLHYKEDRDKRLPPEYLLTDVLKPLFGVQDAKTDQRVTYIHQNGDDLSGVMSTKGFTIGFRLPSVDVAVLKETALNGGVMPPKSTYIEPKLRSGMLLHVFK